MKKIFTILCMVGLLASCELDQYPHTETTSKDVYTSVENYESVLSGIYTSMIVNRSSIADDDRLQNYTRVLIMFQEATTDNLDNVWAAGETTTELNDLAWTAGSQWVAAIYYHIYNIVSLCNEFIRNSSDEKINRFSAQEKEQIIIWRNEARCLRALAYYHALDHFPVVPFVTEKDPVGSFIPTAYDRKQLFTFLEGELSELCQEGALRSLSYGHVTRGTAAAILAKMYLNAEVYVNEKHYSECISACKTVLESYNYSLEPVYTNLFNADNHKRTNEIIFTLACNAVNTVAWGAGTYMVCGTRFQTDAGNLKEFGVNGYWDCLRARPELIDKFEEGDKRALFGSRDRVAYADATDDWYKVEGDTEYAYKDREKKIAQHDDITTGWFFNKWSNLNDNGEAASDTAVNGAETDYPIFRLADVYLMLAEAVLRGGEGATESEALQYVNDIRTRAYGNTSGNITAAELNLDFILDERARELYTEITRRTDLIRFGKYTSGYNWNWKGGKIDGTDVESKYMYLPIPEAELSANPDMKAINTQYGF